MALTWSTPGHPLHRERLTANHAPLIYGASRGTCVAAMNSLAGCTAWSSQTSSSKCAAWGTNCGKTATVWPPTPNFLGGSRFGVAQGWGV